MLGFFTSILIVFGQVLDAAGGCHLCSVLGHVLRPECILSMSCCLAYILQDGLQSYPDVIRALAVPFVNRTASQLTGLRAKSKLKPVLSFSAM